MTSGCSSTVTPLVLGTEATMAGAAAAVAAAMLVALLHPQGPVPTASFAALA